MRMKSDFHITQGRKMHSHDRGEFRMTSADTCVPPFLLVDTQVAQTLWNFAATLNFYANV